MKTKTYDLIKKLLTNDPELRDSDKKLIWEVWDQLNLTDSFVYISRLNFMKAPSTETIRRCRQKIQELHPELQSSKRIRELREEKEKEKGTFIFREQTKLV